MTAHDAVSNTVGVGLIWEADRRDLCQRWLHRPENIAIAEAHTPAQILDRVEKRSGAVREFVKLARRKPLDGRRRWENSWSPRSEWERLSTVFTVAGCKVKISSIPMTAGMLAVPSGSAEDSLIIEQHLAESLAIQLRVAGLRLPFDWESAAVILLARELFAHAAQRMGHRPKLSWIDAVAPDFFAQDILGLPFNPWVAELIETN